MLSNIIELTFKYLHYASEIKILIDNNQDDNIYPRITLIASIHNYKSDYPDSVYAHWNDYLSKNNFTLNYERVKCNYKRYWRLYQLLGEHKGVWIQDFFTFFIIECYKLKPKDLLDERLIRKINKLFEFKFKTGEEVFNITDIVDIRRGFQIFDFYDITKSAFSLTFKADEMIKRQKKKSNSIMKISFDVENTNYHLQKKLRKLPIIFHSQPIYHSKEMTMIDSKKPLNYTILLTKTKRLYLGPPYSQCNHYRSDTKRPFNIERPVSHMQCYRHCLRGFAQNNNQTNCTPLFIDKMISEFDFFTEEKEICTFEKRLIFEALVIEENIQKKCLQLCPRDCLIVDYSYDIRRSDSEMDFLFKTNNRSEVSIVWDSRQPMLSYIEESVLSFTDYLVICGGLLGLWFGTNAKDLFIKIIESRFIFELMFRIKNIIRTIFSLTF